jgi:hypothetical protein
LHGARETVFSSGCLPTCRKRRKNGCKCLSCAQKSN